MLTSTEQKKVLEPNYKTYYKLEYRAFNSTRTACFHDSRTCMSRITLGFVENWASSIYHSTANSTQLINGVALSAVD